jgi:hypothetical protein
MGRPAYSGVTGRIPYRDVEAIDADQTQSITSGGTVTSSVTVPSGEVWELVGFGVDVPATDQATNTHTVTLTTQTGGIELALGTDTGGAPFGYASGAWTGTSGRVDAKGTRLEAGDGVDASYQVVTDDQTGTRQIRFLFNVERV